MSARKKNAPAQTTAVATLSPEALLVEVAWEVCQQVGGIYTVLQSKTPSMMERWGDRYCVVGPYNAAAAAAEFEPEPVADAFGQAVEAMRLRGYDVQVGRWLVSGRPRAVLMNVEACLHRIDEIKYFLWQHHVIATPSGDGELDRVLAFGHMVREFFGELTRVQTPTPPIVAHFHEWMGGSAILDLRRDRIPVSIVFTTHATLLGRYLATADYWFYDHLPFANWENDARRFNIEPRVRIERAAAHGAHVFTTVSDVTAVECRYLLGRDPDFILPNGLSVERFVALHEVENLHRIYKDAIHQTVMSHFFPSYSFDLDKTLYFFTSGRFEYRNKGFDLALEALARLNHRLKQENCEMTVVMFIISKRPFRTIHPNALNSKGVMEEMRRTCATITNDLGERLFLSLAKGVLPNLNDLVDEYWRLRMRRTMQAWRTGRQPCVVTHDLYDSNNDEVLSQIRNCRLFNDRSDPIKIIYHPDFITPSNPLFGMEYDHFVRGCHLGLFPSYYEPWGYTPLECMARGIPAVTSDLAGFGDFMLRRSPDCEKNGLWVIRRKHKSYDEAAGELTERLLGFIDMERRDRIAMRFRCQNMAESFDWHYLARHYDEAHILALHRRGT